MEKTPIEIFVTTKVVGTDVPTMIFGTAVPTRVVVTTVSIWVVGTATKEILFPQSLVEQQSLS